VLSDPVILAEIERWRMTVIFVFLAEFLSDIGVKALRQRFGRLLGIARVSRNKTE
jgi:hypothetical protein